MNDTLANILTVFVILVVVLWIGFIGYTIGSSVERNYYHDIIVTDEKLQECKRILITEQELNKLKGEFDK